MREYRDIDLSGPHDSSAQSARSAPADPQAASPDDSRAHSGSDEPSFDGSDFQDDSPSVAEPSSRQARRAGGTQTGETSAEDSVLNILADVESKLNRIRKAQSDQDDQLASLEQRSRALDEREAAIAEQAKRVAQREADLKNEEARIAQAVNQAEARMQEIDRRGEELEGRAATVGDTWREFEDERQKFETERGKVQKAQSLLEQQVNDLKAERQRLSQISAELDAREQQIGRELDKMRAGVTTARNEINAATSARDEAVRKAKELEDRVEKAEANVGELIRKLEATQEELEQRGSALEKAQREHSILQNQLRESADRIVKVEQHKRELESETGSLRSGREEAEREIQSLRASLQEAEQRTEKSEAEAKKAMERATLERETLAKQNDSITEERDRLKEEIESQTETIKERESTIARQEETLRAAKGKLAEFAKAIGEQAEQINRGAEAIATAREQKQQIERLKKQLAQAQMAGDPEELQRKESRVRELTEALRQARGQSVSNDDIAERDQRIDTLQEENDQLRNDLQRTRIELTEAQQRAQQQAGKSRESNDAQIMTLNARIRELEAELAEAQTHPVTPDAQNEAVSDQLREKMKHLKQAAEHLRRRKTRLARARRLIRDRKQKVGVVLPDAPQPKASREDIQQRMQLSAKLEHDRQILKDTARCLAESEQAMIRRWARPRAVVTMAWFCIIAAILAAGAWFAADHVFPAKVAGSVVLQAKARPGFPLTDEQTAAWQTWHEQLVNDESFARTAAQRFESRRVERFSEAGILSQYLDENLAIDATQPGEIVLTLTGTDAAELTTVLDTLGITLVSESRRQEGKRTDGARTILAGERKVDGQTRYATLADLPIEDERLRYASYIFGGLFGLTFFLMIIIYSRLARARRVFDDSVMPAFAALPEGRPSLH